MIIRRTKCYRRARIFLLNMRLKAKIRDLHALSMQRAADLQEEQTLLHEIHDIKEQLGEYIPYPMHRKSEPDSAKII